MAVEFQWSALNPLPQKGGKYIIYMKISEIFLINWKCRNLIKQCYTQYFLNSSYFLRSFTQILSGERTFSLFFCHKLFLWLCSAYWLVYSRLVTANTARENQIGTNQPTNTSCFRCDWVTTHLAPTILRNSSIGSRPKKKSL